MNHQKSVHMGRKFQCSQCNHQATWKSDLLKHQKSVHMGQKFQCPECDHQATQKGHLLTHQKSFHMSDLKYLQNFINFSH